MSEDLNEVIISGIINNIKDDNQKYIKFGLITIKYNNKIYSSLNINRNLYTMYRDFFNKGTKVFIKGYLNSYILNRKIQSFITVTDISNNQDDLINGKRGPHIRYDPDGIEVWNGKREEKILPNEKELKEIEEILKEYK